ncbi:MAG: Gfo/Idh/MocA family oxidoreductase [Bryobacteraceae bacterium]|nr:Gfo/Idh/MocA family oxidoreductase [Bryobacteraceae bacterium]
MRRRAFVLGGAAATMAAAPGGRPIRIAFLGGGHGHGSAKVALAGKSPDWDLAGICEPDAELMARYERMGVRALTRAQVLEDPSIEVVGVEGWVWELAASAKAALEAGKHIHLDKPPAASMAEMREILDLAQRRKRLVQVGYMWRYNPAVNLALEAARAGWLGEIFQIRGVINTTIDAAERKKLARFVGGQMFELGGHLIDPIIRLMGRPERVTPYLRHDFGALDDGLTDNTMAVLEWRGAIGTVATASMHHRSPTAGGNSGALPYRALEIYGTQGAAVVRPIEPPSLLIDLTVAAGPYKAGPQTQSFTYARYVDDFIELAAAVRGEGKLRVRPEEDLLVEESLLRASGMEG